MRRRILVVVVLIGCTLAVRAALSRSKQNADSQHPAQPDPELCDETTTPVDGFEVARRDAATPEPPVSVMELRGRYRELSEKRSLRMTARELVHAIEGIEKTMAEQDRAAEAVLMQGVGRLHEAMTRYPGTEASVRASRALETLGFYVARDGRLERHAVAPATNSFPDEKPAEEDGTARDNPFGGFDRNAMPVKNDGTGEAARGNEPAVEP